MKSEQRDNPVQTSCKECLFAKYDGITQTDCLADRLKHFDGDIIEAYDEEKEFYVINRTCTFIRPKSWNEGKSEVEKARLEVKTSFGLFINLPDFSEEELVKTVGSIKKINYDKSKIVVTMCHLQGGESELYVKLLGDLLNAGVEAYLSVSIHEAAKEWDNLNRFRNCLFFSIVSAGQEIDADIFSRCDEALNDDGKIFASAQRNGTSLLLTKIFLNHYIEYKSIYEIEEALMLQSKEEEKHESLDG